MQNLAGKPNADQYIRSELERCGINVVEHNEALAGEVHTTLTGSLKGFVFQRRWYYWSVSGNVPLKVARALYNDNVGREDIRVNGHCGCPSPENGQITWVDEEGRILIPKAELDMYGPNSSIREIVLNAPDYKVVENITTGIPVIKVYHIDSELGLYIFAQHIKKYLEGLN